MGEMKVEELSLAHVKSAHDSFEQAVREVIKMMTDMDEGRVVLTTR